LEAATLGGGRLAPHLANPADRMALLVACDGLWACSVLVALSLLATFFQPHRAERAAPRGHGRTADEGFLAPEVDVENGRVDLLLPG
jgi:hypothetical protein